jgi:hypothetical protein
MHSSSSSAIASDMLLSCFPASCRMLPSRVLQSHAFACSAVAWAFALTQPDRVQWLAVLSVGFPGGLAAVDTDRYTAAAAAAATTAAAAGDALLSCFPAGCCVLVSSVV